MQSFKYSLNTTDLIKIAKLGAYTVGGSLVAFILSTIPTVNFGQYAIYIVPLASVGLISLNKYLQGEIKSEDADINSPDIIQK